MDLARLRQLLDGPIVALKDHGTHERLPEFCASLGLPIVVEGSKRDRMRASFAAVTDEDLPRVATNFLKAFPPPASLRNQIEDVLSAADAWPPISKRCRRELTRSLDREDLFQKAEAFDALLDRLWVLDDGAFAFFMDAPSSSLRAQIERHVHNNPDDWSVETLFEKLGALDASDRRFALFLEGLVGADVRPDEADQRRVVRHLNEVLRTFGLELVETASGGGYPVFSLVQRAKGASGTPKNLIFASTVKPDLRFRDAVNNDVEIVQHADKVLVFDRPIPTAGLRWRDLQSWWEATTSTEGADAKKSLYKRLLGSLPQNSPPQTLLFETFFRTFGHAVPDLPVLLPEVWLHYDPRTVAERGRDALLRQRMDFLLLLSHEIRIVIEVDGVQHYADASGRADPARYGAATAADRELRLAGYEVYRFGGSELASDDGAKVVADFFRRLFERHGIT